MNTKKVDNRIATLQIQIYKHLNILIHKLFLLQGTDELQDWAIVEKKDERVAHSNEDNTDQKIVTKL